MALDLRMRNDSGSFPRLAELMHQLCVQPNRRPWRQPGTQTFLGHVCWTPVNCFSRALGGGGQERGQSVRLGPQS